MKIQKIFSRNATYQKFEVLKSNRNKRYKYNEFIVEGVRNINEAIINNWKINSFIYSSEKNLSTWAIDILRNTNTICNYELTEGLMNDLSKKEDSSELLAIIQMKDDKGHLNIISENPIIVLFDRPSNKGNLGTIFRSCDSFGIERLIITGHSVDIYDPDVISSSMGSFFKLPFIKLSDNIEIDNYINSLRGQYPNINIIGTTAHQKTTLQDVDLSTPVLFMIGNETDGLNRHLSEICDTMATIPMSKTASASSLNVGCAATVMFYEASRQRS